MCNVSGQISTHATAHVPVSSECTIDTERFLHFQERHSLCWTTLGEGSLRNKWRTTLKRRAYRSTDGPGCLFSARTRSSILSTSSSVQSSSVPSFLLPAACCLDSVAPPVGGTPPRWVTVARDFFFFFFRPNACCSSN